METCRMEFSGRLLKRGFWLYIWDVKDEGRRHLYVGRTGDTASPYAASPFRRIGQHLDFKVNAKSNALYKRLREAGINPMSCTFEMVAIGPIFEEQADMSSHKPLRDATAALESALAEELQRRGYNVLGTHPRSKTPDPELMQQVIAHLGHSFPSQVRDTGNDPLCFDPVPLMKPGLTASELVILDRGEYIV